MNLNNPYSNSNLWRHFTKSGCAEGIIHAFCWVQTRTKDTLEKVFLRKCQALCFHSVLFSGLKRVLYQHDESSRDLVFRAGPQVSGGYFYDQRFALSV